MAKTLTYAITTGGGTLDPTSLHDALVFDTDYSSLRGTTNADGVYEGCDIILEHDGTNVYITVPDATVEATLLTKVDAQRA